MAWYSVVLKTALILLHPRLYVGSTLVFLGFPIQVGMNGLHIQKLSLYTL